MKDFFMSVDTKNLSAFLLLLLIMFPGGHAAHSANGVTLYTPYTEISVPPGESIDYTVEVINNSSVVRNMSIALSGLSKEWKYDMKAGGWAIGQISVLPGEKKSIDLTVDVPLKIDKGSYRFRLVASGYDVLPLTVNVSEQGTFKTEFTTEQPNMEGPANSSFTFNAELKNSTLEQQLYALKAKAPRGWNVTFRANRKQATSVNIDPNSTEDITIEIDPPDRSEAGTYKIPVRATTANTSADLELEVVVTGSYEMELTTPTGLLSSDITAGDEKRVELLVKNSGSADLKDIELDFSAPVKWEVTFEPKKVGRLEPGKNAQVFATIKAYKKSIAGDYVTKLEARTPEASSEVSYRMSVKTSMLWGWVGILIILGVLGGVFYLFRKYGRR